MLAEWLYLTSNLPRTPGLHISGKYIVRGYSFKVPAPVLLKPDITLDMLGFQKKKLTILRDYYYHEESINVALTQLAHRRKKKSYGSTGVTCYNHFAKKERPTHGPCIQSVVFTHLPTGVVDVDVFYRTTEIFKKLAADFVFLRDIVLPQFNPTGDVHFRFANATWHPMYWAVAAPYYDDPCLELDYLANINPQLHSGVIRWTQRFLSQPDSLLKFKQGFRVSKHLHRLMDPYKLKELRKKCLRN